MANSVEKMIATTFMEMAEGLETGSFGKRPKIALTGMGSEHGEENSMAAAVEAAKDGIDVYYIGTLEAEGVTTVKVANDEEGHDKMEEMLKNKEIDAAVTMHFPFPIGVSTVGRCVTPAYGKEMYIANTTGTSSTDRIEGMIKNAVYGIIAAGERISDHIRRVQPCRRRMRDERKRRAAGIPGHHGDRFPDRKYPGEDAVIRKYRRKL